MMVSEIPATVPVNRDGKASDDRDKSEDLPDKSNIQCFREEKLRIITDSHFNSPSALDVNIRALYVIGNLYDVNYRIKNVPLSLRNTLFCIVFFSAIPLFGQRSIEKDTIKIQEVVISRNKPAQVSAGYKNTIIDDAVLGQFSSSNLSEMLSGSSLIFMKNYGMSGTATPSFRGTGASQTLITWNGLNINSPMLGQSDLSIIPAGLIDDVQIYYGGASMILNNGGIGGAVNLENKPDWKKGINGSVSTGMGSFGEYLGFAKIKTGDEHFQSVTKAFFLNSENNFKYENTPDSWLTMANSQIHERGFTQELYFKNPINTVSARLWYQDAGRHLPAIGTDLHERQSDESIRLMINDDISSGKTTYFITGAWLEDRMHYTNHIGESFVDSRNRSDMLILKTGSETLLSEFTKLRFNLNNEFSIVNTNNYDKRKMRNTVSLTTSFERECIDRFGLTLLLREIITQKKLLIPDFSGGIQFRVSDNMESFIKANISRNSRVPTMNDLYYNPYGNQDLKNEYAYIYELSYQMNHNFSNTLKINSEISVFRNYINDMILWHIQGNNLSVDNINKVKTTGLEANVNLKYSANKFSVLLNTGYSYTKATTVVSYIKNDAAIGKQLLYIPENQANGMMQITYGHLYSSWSLILTGDRYTATDNSIFLPGYLLNNIIMGIKIPFNNTSVDLNLNINNMFAVQYQSVSGYPMPGRSYLLNIILQLNK
jgi:outer membrane cobalamin receptor